MSSMKNLCLYEFLHIKIKTCILSLLKGENTYFPFLEGMQSWMLKSAWSFLHIAELGMYEVSIHLLAETKRKEKDPLLILLSNSETQVSNGACGHHLWRK